MSDKIDTMIYNLSVFNENMDRFILEDMLKNEETIVELNRERMSRGLDINELPIGYITSMTNWYKRMRAYDNHERPDGVADLYNTGAFYDSIHLEIIGDELWTLAEDIKWHAAIGGRTPLSDEFSEDALGLSDYDADTFIIPGLIDTITEELRNAI